MGRKKNQNTKNLKGQGEWKPGKKSWFGLMLQIIDFCWTNTISGLPKKTETEMKGMHVCNTHTHTLTHTHTGMHHLTVGIQSEKCIVR